MARTENRLVSIGEFRAGELPRVERTQDYLMITFEGALRFMVDGTEYSTRGPGLLFLSPFQGIRILSENSFPVRFLGFHSDIYCIEQHRDEIACNGVLFNDVYVLPYFVVDRPIFEKIGLVFNDVQRELLTEGPSPISDSVIKSYIQLVLAISTREKLKRSTDKRLLGKKDPFSVSFRRVLEENFRNDRCVSFYADSLGLDRGNLGKKTKKRFGRSPKDLIAERVILVAKKMLHMSLMPIKHIAHELNFQDELYFSRYFRKHTGTSPTVFRKRVGISDLAKKSI